MSVRVGVLCVTICVRARVCECLGGVYVCWEVGVYVPVTAGRWPRNRHIDASKHAVAGQVRGLLNGGREEGRGRVSAEPSATSRHP